MRVRLKYVLPLAQIAVELWLIHQAQEWYAHRHGDALGMSSPDILRVSINAPVQLASALWRHMEWSWTEEVIRIAAIGTF